MEYSQESVIDAYRRDSSVNIQIRCASEIEPESVEWLWKDWLAKGKLAILAGQAGTGKTTICMNLAATISTGGKFPDGTTSPIGSILVWSGEDGIGDTLVPRLMAADADLSKIHFLNDVMDNFEIRSFNPAIDMQNLLIQAASIPDLALLVIDPIVNAVAGDGNSNNIVRKALQPIVDFASKRNCAVIGISHFSKGGQGKDPLERVTGSVAYGALARVVMSAAKVNDGDISKRILCRTKNNLGKDDGGFEYDIQQRNVKDEIFSSYVIWGIALEGSASELLIETTDESSYGCSEFLEELLASGRQDYRSIMQEGQNCGFNKDQLNRAKRKLKIHSHRTGFGKGSVVYWDLPPHKNHIDSIHSGLKEAPPMPPMVGGDHD